MTTLDWVLAAGLGLGIWRGVRTGALAQAVGTVGWLLGFVVATAFDFDDAVLDVAGADDDANG